MFSKQRRPCAEWTTRPDKILEPREDICSFLELYRLENEAEKLTKQYEERKQYLAHVKQQIKELKKNIEQTDDRRYSREMFQKEKDSKVHMQKVQREIRLLQENEKMMEKLKKKNAKMAEWKQELLRQVERHSVYKDFLEKVLQQSQFKDVDELVSHLENLLHTRDKLFEKRNQVEEQTDQQKKTLETLEDQHNLLLLQKSNELSQLQTELDQARSETLAWEKKWDHIQETAAKKLVELGQIKMATVNLYELTGGVVGAEGVDINDTDLQLDQIKIYMKDLNDIVRQYQIIISEKNADAKNSKKDRRLKFHLILRPAVPGVTVLPAFKFVYVNKAYGLNYWLFIVIFRNSLV
ncbi:coiled-coil domain-containing protein 42 homolog [Melanotaenia boesemani]|uniref:coiled-coil domain-containing protein 42 homolog n=1 Tax=Melanotaenia boesemani TaxID=1250792 RepID=UPI001C057D2E|nr:coiled-coil domain-containing protein 42 homolog [Melanotaenia boesemani]